MYDALMGWGELCYCNISSSWRISDGVVSPGEKSFCAKTCPGNKELINLDVLEDGANELAGSKVSDGAA